MTEEEVSSLEARLTAKEVLPGHNLILVPVMIPDGITVKEEGCLASEALALIAEVRRLRESCPPPYVQCEMCNEVDCCEGEWTDGSERTCLHCGCEGVMTAFQNHNMHWVLTALYDEEDEE